MPHRHPRGGLQCEKLVDPWLDGRKRRCTRSGQHVRVVDGVTVFYCWQHAKLAADGQKVAKWSLPSQDGPVVSGHVWEKVAGNGDVPQTGSGPGKLREVAGSNPAAPLPPVADD